jgi:hypothetical protein
VGRSKTMRILAQVCRHTLFISAINMNCHILATLISGPSTAEVIYNDAVNRITLDIKCAVNGDVANCVATGAADGSTVSLIETDTVSPFEVQGSFGVGGASVPTSTPTSVASNSAGTPNTTPSAGSGLSRGPVATGSTNSISPSPSPSPSTHSNGALGAIQPLSAVSVGLMLLISSLIAL